MSDDTAPAAAPAVDPVPLPIVDPPAPAVDQASAEPTPPQPSILSDAEKLAEDVAAEVENVVKETFRVIPELTAEFARPKLD